MADLHRGRSVRALASVGSFLGLQPQDETLNQWKHSTEERAKQGKIGFALVPKVSQFDRPNVDIQAEINDEEEEDESAYALELGASLSNILESCSVDRIRLRAFTKGMFKPSELSGEPLCDSSLENREESGIEELDTERGIKPSVRFEPEISNPGYMEQSHTHLVTMDTGVPTEVVPSGVVNMLLLPDRYHSEAAFPANETIRGHENIVSADFVRRRLSVKFSEKVTESDISEESEESEEMTSSDSEESESDDDDDDDEDDQTQDDDDDESSYIDDHIVPSPQTSTPKKAVPPSPNIRPAKSALKNKDEHSPIHEASLPSHLLGSDEFIYRMEALEQYREYIQLEKALRLKDLRTRRDTMHETILGKQRKIDELIKVAQAHYCSKHGVEDSSWTRLIRSFRKKDPTMPPQTHGTSMMHVRRQIEALPQYIPWFTYTICLVQIVAFCVVCGLGGVTSIGLEPRLELQAGVITLLGLETKEHWHIPNIWIGPARYKMIGFGAVFAPCMRQDQLIQQTYSTTYNITDGAVLGCCVSPNGQAAATIYQEQCQQMSGGSGVWQVGVTCSQRIGVITTPQNIWPCCHGYRGECQMTTLEHCQFLEGIYHSGHAEHCTQVNCLSSLCGLGGLESDLLRPFSPSAPNQGYRLVLAIFYHHGVVHLVLVVVTQFVLARPIEIMAGWVRMMCIYMIPAIMGVLMGVIMEPYSPHVGGSGGLFGLVAVVAVELSQSWKLVPKPWLEVLKLIGAFILFFLAGTLPCVDNFSLITGFLCGILCGIIFLPYVTFGRRHMIARRVLIGVALPMLVFLVVLLFYLFYVVQTVSCDWCKFFNCLPYTDSMCRVLELW